MKNNIDISHLPYAGHILHRAAQLWPERTALICNNRGITYYDLYIYALRFSAFLKTKNVQPRDKIILIWENSLEFYIAYHAAWQIGAIVAPLNIFLHEKELEHIITDCQPKLIITSEPQYAKLQKITLLVPEIIRSHDLTHALQSTDKEIALQALDHEELSILLYTSGTTGMPKGVMLSSKNILTNAQQALTLFKTDTEERIYGALPLFHSYMQNTCIWSACIAGSTVLLVHKIDRNSLKKALDLQPTIVLGIPSLYGLFCIMKHVTFPSVKLFISGGDALPDKIRMAFALFFNRKICNGYGLSETSPFIAVDLDDQIGATSTVGKPLDGIQIEIRDENNKPVQPGTIGTLWVHGDNVMLGYYNAPEATNAILHNNWLNTGDLARITPDGKIVIAGRQKDLIVHKGIKIYPQEIENVLMSHAQVIAAAVLGKQENNDEIPIAFVAVKTLSDNLKEELANLCAQNLATYKIPRLFIIKKELPTTATGKIDKKILKKELYI